MVSALWRRKSIEVRAVVRDEYEIAQISLNKLRFVLSPNRRIGAFEFELGNIRLGNRLEIEEVPVVGLYHCE